MKPLREKEDAWIALGAQGAVSWDSHPLQVGEGVSHLLCCVTVLLGACLHRELGDCGGSLELAGRRWMAASGRFPNQVCWDHCMRASVKKFR